MAINEINPDAAVLAAFGLDSSDWKIGVLKRGHINHTYILTLKDAENPSYLLQHINSYVFPKPEKLMRNMELVTRVVRDSNIREGNDPELHGLTLIRTVNGKPCYSDPEGEIWRMVKYIPDHIVFEVVSDEETAKEGGRAFGKFLRQLTALQQEDLTDVIEGFHDLNLRLRQFDEALRNADEERKRMAAEEIAETEKQRKRFASTPLCDPASSLPVRVTHNDTKFNNLLFSSNGKALCVVDLDTVMKGHVHYDFGDAIRTSAATAPEDVEDTGRMKFNRLTFKAFSEGYLSEVSTLLSQEEAESLYLAPSYFAFIMGLRFLTDYLSGDKYFQILRKNHNLQRTRAQYKLLKEMQAAEEEMREVIAQFYGKYC